jgi:hypothetical protein
MFENLQITGLIDVPNMNVANDSLYVQNLCAQKNVPLVNSLRNAHTYLETVFMWSLTAQTKRTPRSFITVSATVSKCRVFFGASHWQGFNWWSRTVPNNNHCNQFVVQSASSCLKSPQSLQLAQIVNGPASYSCTAMYTQVGIFWREQISSETFTSNISQPPKINQTHK